MENITSTKQVNVFFSGTVQGVGFRFAVKNIADNFMVTGCVRNRSDGRVELVAEGQTQELEDFLKEIERTMSAYISKKIIEWNAPEKKYDSFEIAATF
jgi:acylphosphatase